MAKEYGYPGDDEHDLARVAQFVSIAYADRLFAKDQVAKVLARYARDQQVPEVLRRFSELPIPLYITTNFDNLLENALRERGRSPAMEICRWSPTMRKEGRERSLFTPTGAEPLVFHLYGQLEAPESMVLSEDDYLDFLVNLSRNATIMPLRVVEALTNSSLLFVGYGMQDIAFRFLFRGLIQSVESSMRRLSVAVMLPGAEPDGAAFQSYSQHYFDGMRIRVYWGSPQQFTEELSARWKVLPA